MLLRHIYLYIPDFDISEKIRTPFSFQTRSLCNYLEKALKKEKFHTNGFSKICVGGVIKTQDGCPIVPENAAAPNVAFDESRYTSLSGNELQEYFIEMLNEGFLKCDNVHSIPKEALSKGIESFRLGGYKNEWEHKSKTFRELGLKATLYCTLTMSEFLLSLIITKNGSVLFREYILKTLPDEIIFSHKFNDLIFDNGAIQTTDKSGKTIHSVSISSLSLKNEHLTSHPSRPAKAGG